MYSVRKNQAGNCDAYSSSTTAFAARRWPIRKIDSGTSGSRANRASTSRNAASRTTPPISGTSTPGAPQPSVSVRTIPNVRLTRLAVTSTAPVRSKWRVPSARADAGIRRVPRRTTMSPSGTLTAKIACHPNAWVRMPPSSAPEDAPRPPTAPHAASPRLRSRPSANEEVMIDSVAGDSTAPLMPCTLRAAISRSRESASAHPSEASANNAVPTRNTRRRPSRSAERPPSIRKPANVSV